MKNLRIYIFESSVSHICKSGKSIDEWIARIQMPFVDRTKVHSVKVTLIKQTYTNEQIDDTLIRRFVDQLLAGLPRLNLEPYSFQTLMIDHMFGELYHIRRNEEHCLFLLDEADLLTNKDTQDIIGKVYWRVLESKGSERIVDFWDTDSKLPVGPHIIDSVTRDKARSKCLIDRKIRLLLISKYAIGLIGSILFFTILGGDIISVFRYALSIFNWGHSSVSLIILTLTFFVIAIIESQSKKEKEKIDSL